MTNKLRIKIVKNQWGNFKVSHYGTIDGTQVCNTGASEFDAKFVAVEFMRHHPATIYDSKNSYFSASEIEKFYEQIYKEKLVA